MKTEMETKRSTKHSCLPENNCLKKFTIPKRTPDKDFLTECSINQRDYNEVKERLNQGCFDTECNLESLWHFEKIEMVHNKDLEEEFVAKRAEMREQGRMDKELSSFLVVSKDEVLKICQSGMHASSSNKKELDIMKAVGNPQLGVYLFRHVDIALNYAFKYSIPAENVIIFRVLLGKVKRMQPPKGKKKVALDPTPNFDCHVSRTQPSVKDSIEDQAIGSLVYFYEYSELSKPVDKPRQCLPHAVVRVKCVNEKVRTNHPVACLKYRPKSFSKGRGQSFLLENCTVVTRIGNTKLIYEHFHKPKNCALSENASAEISLSESAHHWDGSVAETLDTKIKQKLPGQWDSARLEADVLNFQCMPDLYCSRGAKNDHMGTSSKNPKDPSIPDTSVSYSESIKDPRLKKGGGKTGEQNGEPVSNGFLQCESKLKCETEMKMSATLGIPCPDPEDCFLLNNSCCAFSQEQYMSKTPWKERISDHRSPFSRNNECSVNNEHMIVNVNQLNREILDSQNTDTDFAVRADLSHSSYSCGIKNVNQILAERDKRIKNPKPFHIQTGHEMLLSQNKNNVNTNSLLSGYISNSTYTHDEEQPVLPPAFQISSDCQNLESVAANKDEMNRREEMNSQLQEDDGYSSEVQCSASLESNHSKNHCTLKRDGESELRRMHVAVGLMRDGGAEDNYVSEWSSGDQAHAEIFEQNKLQEIAHSRKSIMNKIPKKTNRQILSSSEIAMDSKGEKEGNTSKNVEECIDTIKDQMDTSDILELESSTSDLRLNFEDKCSLTDSQLTKIEGGEEKLSDIPDQALLTQCTGLTAPLIAEHITSTPVPPGSLKDTETKHPQSENMSHSENQNFGALNKSLSSNNCMPVISEQQLAVKCRGISTPEVEVNSETEMSKGYKKCVSIPQKPCRHVDMPSEAADSVYHFLQERMDWESLLIKPSPNTEIFGRNSVREDKHECSNEGKIDVEGKATELLNIYVRPDLQITVANTHLDYSSLEKETEMGKCVTKCSEQTRDIKWLQEKRNGKCTLGQKNSRLYYRKKVLNALCSSEMALSLSKGQFKIFEKSEMHIKNVLRTLNTEASLCKNRHLSRKISGAVCHLQKAQRSVQNYFKILSKTAKQKSNSPESHNIIPGNLLESSDHGSYNVTSAPKRAACFTEQKRPKIGRGTHAIEIREAGEKTNCKLERQIESEGNLRYSTTCFLTESHSAFLHFDSSLTSAFNSNMPCSNDERVIDLEISENSTSSGTVELVDMKPTSNEHRVNSEQKMYANIVSENVVSKNILLPSWEGQSSSVPAELSISHADQVEEEDSCESNVKSTVNLATSVQKSSEKLNSSKPDISKLSPIFSEKEALELSPVEPKNIIMSVDIREACTVLDALVSVAKNGRDAQDPLFLSAPQISSTGLNTKTNSSSNLGEVCSEKQAEQHELCENMKCKLLIKPVIQPDNNIERLNGYLTQTDQVTSQRESTSKQTSLTSTEKVTRCHSALLLETNSCQEVLTAAMILPDVEPNKKNQNCSTPESRPKDRCLSGEHRNNCKDITSDTKLKIEMEPTALDFLMRMSEILQKADETSCLHVLQEQVIVCKNILPLFIKAFEEKQDCSFQCVLVLKETAEKGMWANLKPSAIDSLVELQIIMETVEFLENKRRYLEGKRTLRTLLWYDDSLYIELFGGQSGYQQQSNFYPAFQRSLKYNALNELQSHHKKLVDKLEKTSLENKSYYCFLKLRREIKECEAAMKGNSLLSEFFLSEPYVCGANYGDTVEDLENVRKSTVGLINACGTLTDIPLSTEKIEHFGIIMDIISTKIEFIRTYKEANIKSSFIGLEHIFFNAAVSCIWREKATFINGDFKNGDGQMLKIYEAALPKLCEIYENRVEKLERSYNSASEEHILKKSAENPCSYEKGDVKGGANYDIKNCLVSYPDICLGEILDEAQSVNLDKLQQNLCRCTQHFEVLKKCFQLIQEEDADHVLITKENVLSCMESTGITAVRLKPEAVELFTEMAMVKETVFFLKNYIAKIEDKPRFRSLLWFDVSLLSELFHCQEKMASFSYRKDNLLETIESAISDLQDELNVIDEYAESLNCSYALQLLTRELTELLETRKHLQMSGSSVCMCVDVVPYAIALNYGSNMSELEYNYEQFYSLLEKLMLADRKDLGKMAHVMKILKTIEHMKFICIGQQKQPLHLVISQMLKNWRKSRRLKRQGDVRRHTDAGGSNSMKHKRPTSITSEDRSYHHEERNDPTDGKKRKVVASLTPTKRNQEKETYRNLRNSVAFERSTEQLPERTGSCRSVRMVVPFPNSRNRLLMQEDLLPVEEPLASNGRILAVEEGGIVSTTDLTQSIHITSLAGMEPWWIVLTYVKISIIDLVSELKKGLRPNPLGREQLHCNKKDEFLKDRPYSSSSYSKGLKVADPLDCIEFSPNVSRPALVNSDKQDCQKNLRDPKDFHESRRDCSRENNQECFVTCDERGKSAPLSPKRDPAPQKPPKDSFNSVHQHHELKQNIIGNVSGVIPKCSPTTPLGLDSNENMYEEKSMPSCAQAYNSDSSAIPELNKFTQPESLCPDLFPPGNTQTPAERSSFSQNAHVEETPHIYNYSVHTYRACYPSYSWCFYQTGSNCHQVTQTYQEFSSYEMHQLNPTMLTATSMVYNTHSSMFYSQSSSHFGAGESQRSHFAQTYPVYNYFSSSEPFPYSYQQWPSWYTQGHFPAQAAFPHSSNIGL